MKISLRSVLLVTFVLLLLGASYLAYCIFAPISYDVPVTLEIEKGTSLKGIAEQLEAEGIVRSADLFYLSIISIDRNAVIQAGSYEIAEPLSTYHIAHSLIYGKPIEISLTLTFPEGFSVRDFATIAESSLENFDPEEFIRIGEDEEGYLFPDTYHVPPTYSARELYTLMRETYEERIEPFRSQIEEYYLSEYEILTFASILEREANSRQSMRMVSGILHNRLDIGMPLQVDAVFEYILDKSPALLTRADLKIDSPYNTYQTTGLPPTPIGNPGITAIEAVLDPIPSNNLFYITGRDGIFYYAETLTQHNINVTRYLR